MGRITNPNPTFGGNPHRRKPPTNCKDCNIVLDESNHLWKKVGISIHNRCKNCYNKRQNEYYKTHTKNYILQAKYGITEERYDELLALQLGLCAVCKSTCVSGDKLSVDHCHTTGEVRGLLCRSCNLALAAVHEDESIIYGLLDYIRKYNDRADVSIRPSLKTETEN